MDKELHNEYTMSYIKTEWQDVEVEKSILDMISHWRHIKPREDAVIFLSTDGTREVISWQDLHENTIKYGKAFQAHGVKKGDVVAMTVRNHADWLYIHFGLMGAGAIPFPLVFTYKDGSDVVAILNKIEKCTTIVMDPEYNENTWNLFKSLLTSSKADGSIVCEKIKSLRYLVCTSVPEDNTPVLSLDTVLETPTNAIQLPEIDPSDVAVLLQTSGSTGVPKAVAHSHNGLVHVASNFIFKDERAAKIDFNDRPFTWLGGWPIQVLMGDTRVCRSGLSEHPTDNTQFIIDAIQQERCITLTALPPLLHALIDRQDTIGDNWPLKTVYTGGQPVTKKMADCLGKLCSEFFNGYGGTEILGVFFNRVTSKTDFEEYSCGTPAVGIEVKIVDDEGETVPVNTAGEIFVKSPRMFVGYFNDQERTKAAFTSDGWYKTDDIGKMTEDGKFFVMGRKSDLILSGGFNVPPAVIETLMKTCPGVKDVVVVPVPDETYYQVLCACVIRQNCSDVTEDELRSFCEELHNDSQRLFTVLPKFYLFMESFPETNTGKTSRKALAALALTLVRGNKD